jgi:acetolactate synthase-1/2/3 large subunit
MLVQETTAVAGPGVRVPMAAPGAEDLAALGDMLAAARRPLVLAGGGGWGAAGRAGLRAFAEGNALPVATVWRYTDTLDNDSPSFIGTAGLGKAASVRRLMLEADLILALGIRFGEITTDNYALFPPPRMAARLVHAHASDLELNKIYTADLPIHAHPDRLLPALAGLRVDAAAWSARTGEARAAWIAELETPPQPGGVDMGAITRHLDATLPDDAILTNGAGNFAIWPNKHFRFGGGRRLLAPQSGAMGYGLPAAIAAKIARPGSAVVCYAGDGDFQMTEAELATAAEMGAPIVVLLVNNGGYGTIRMHQERNYPGRVSFTELANPDFAAMARSFGMHGERVARTVDFAAAFARALAAPGGAVLDLAVDIEALTPRASLSAIRAAALGEGAA